MTSVKQFHKTLRQLNKCQSSPQALLCTLYKIEHLAHIVINVTVIQ